jgi:hypothetical protein
MNNEKGMIMERRDWKFSSIDTREMETMMQEEY